MHQVEAVETGICVVAHDLQAVGRGHVPARRKLFRRHVERDLDLANVAFELGSPTHRFAVLHATQAGLVGRSHR